MSLSRRFRRLTSQDDSQGPSGSSNPDPVSAPAAPDSSSTPHPAQPAILVSSPSPSPVPGTTPIQSQSPAPPTTASSSPFKASKRAAREGWSGLKKLLAVLDKSGMFGPLQGVVEQLLELVEMYDRTYGETDRYEALEQELEKQFEDLCDHLSGPTPQIMTGSIRNLCKNIETELDALKSKSAKRQKGSGGPRHHLELGNYGQISECYRRIHAQIQRLTLNTNLSMWKMLDVGATNALLDRLTPVKAATYNSAESATFKRGECTEGTRVDVLAQMYSWVYSSPAGALYWLNGMAGTGKTTIAYSLCSGLETANRLGASFFCSRLLDECREVSKIIPSVAYQLARFSRPFCCALLRVLSEEPDVHQRVLRVQFQKLIVGPLAEVKDTLPTDLVVVIDALDECKDQDSTRQILDLVLSKAWTLPIRFFVSSRPEPQIRDEMMLQGGLRANERLVLHELDKGIVQGDIATYLRSALAPIFPSETELSKLAELAGVLFIYAATAVRYIGYRNFQNKPRARLETILRVAKSPGDCNKHKEIDELYGMILKSALDDPNLDASDRADMRLVLHTIVCVKEPLTTYALSGLLKLSDSECVESALSPLWSVLHVMEDSNKVTTLHASFPDYLFDQDRSREHYCDEDLHNERLAILCFECIHRTKPKFNLCSLESSYLLDSQVPDLGERIQSTISTELFYACRRWADHFPKASGRSSVAQALELFLAENLLLWMEVLNLKECIHLGIEIMWKAEDYCARQLFSDSLIEPVHDAWRYVLSFASSNARQSTPHIYISALPYWPPESPIAKRYSNNLHGMIRPVGPALHQRQLSMLATWSFEGPIQCALFSPDAAQVAMAVEKDLILVDSINGQPIRDPFVGHCNNITSLDYSPDGKLIASGSDDRTVRIWDPQTGRLVVDPLTGHTRAVACVSFSPDGTCIATGSYDKSIRLWDVGIGATAPRVFEGHTSWVTAVRFSPSSTSIVSGSSDNTVRVWDTASGQNVLVLKGHSSRVTSVKFSSDGTRLISGSYDKTVRVWDLQSGKRIGGLFKGHSGRVTTIAISPDGRYIASGADDKSVRMWDLATEKTVLGPLEMHTDVVNSVAFSARGGHLISSSKDKTLKVWDIRSKRANFGKSYVRASIVISVDLTEGTGTGGTLKILPPVEKRNCVNDQFHRSRKNKRGRTSETGPLPDPVQGHTNSVSSVAFSPDGSRIVSSSYDMNIRVWDSQTGLTVLGPLQGHTGWAFSVAFSPDGSRIVSGSRDKTIRVWDSQTGLTVLGPLQGHTEPVTSVAFSPDGSRIVSGSDDKTIRVWDSQTGLTVLGPLQEYNINGLISVAFSPDGSRIVSSSYDVTIRVWDSQTGLTVLGPLQGHTGWVFSVAFSPDGSRIVSGSRDKTIRVWDSQTGLTVLGPLQGHTEPVTSVAFSPDGSHIVSGSYDMTIRVWDSQTGLTVLGPLQGHTEPVTSVAFSPDGSRIVSGSDDKTIRVWDSQTGLTVLGPLQEYNINGLISVAFSPDGSRIVSSSYDVTIRVWDSQTGLTVLGPLQGHTGWVFSVAFSPDGSRIVSGSRDKTIRVWDSQTGLTVLGPLQGHANWVTSVAFSPDGLRIVSGSSGQSLIIWDIRETVPQISNQSSQRTYLPSDPDLGVTHPWSLKDDGWVVDSHSRLLVHVPSDLRKHLLPARAIRRMGGAGVNYLQLDMDEALLGKRWTQIYRQPTNRGRPWLL